MTIQKLIDKYIKLIEAGKSTLTINQAIIGLRLIQLSNVRKFKAKGKLEDLL